MTTLMAVRHKPLPSFVAMNQADFKLRDDKRVRRTYGRGPFLNAEENGETARRAKACDE
jgi:hypothetical protein